MQQNKTTAWQGKLTGALSQDPKKTGVLGFLAVILLIVCARMSIGNSRPAPAAGSPLTAYAGAAPPFVPSPVLKPGGAAASLRGWLNTPIGPIGRNDFLVKSEYFPPDATRKTEGPSDSSFWTTLTKSLSVQADQKEKREAAIADLKLQAAALRPSSTVIGPSPRAMVNGAIVREGDTVASFRVVKIEPHGIVVESDGVELLVPMD